MADEYRGRLVVIDGKLYAHGDGTTEPFAMNDDGTANRDEVLLREVAHDPDNGMYVYIDREAGDLGHNEQHHQEFKAVNGTLPATYDAEGTLLYEGDPHHFYPLPNDPHFEEGARDTRNRLTHTKLKFDDDDIAPVVTGHTDAYMSGA